MKQVHIISLKNGDYEIHVTEEFESPSRATRIRYIPKYDIVHGCTRSESELHTLAIEDASQLSDLFKSPIMLTVDFRG